MRRNRYGWIERNKVEICFRTSSNIWKQKHTTHTHMETDTSNWLEHTHTHTKRDRLDLLERDKDWEKIDMVGLKEIRWIYALKTLDLQLLIDLRSFGYLIKLFHYFKWLVNSYLSMWIC